VAPAEREDPPLTRSSPIFAISALLIRRQYGTRRRPELCNEIQGWLESTLAAKHSSGQKIFRRVIEDEDPEAMLDRMIANGEIAKHQRGDVLPPKMEVEQMKDSLSQPIRSNLTSHREIDATETAESFKTPA
jgi:hypothetical protein